MVSSKEPACQRRRHGFNFWAGKIPWRRKCQSTPVILPGKSHGQRSLVGYSPWNSPGQNTRVGSLSLLQGIFPNQGSNPGLQPCRQILYHLSHKGSPQNKHYQIIISCHHMVMSIISLEVTGCKWAICPDARWSNPR